MRKRIRLSLAAGLLAAVAAVSLNTVARAQAGKGPKAGEKLAAFTATDTDGKPVSLASYKGSKVVLVDFWATWCPPCRAEVPHIVKAYKDYHAKGFDILGVSMDRDKAPLAEYTKKNDMPWRQVYDKDTEFALAKKFDVQFIPTSYLVDVKTGKILAVSPRGEALAAELKKVLK